MNVERILNMIVHRVIMRFVNRGIDAGIDKVSGSRKNKR